MQDSHAGNSSDGSSDQHTHCLNCGTELKGTYCHQCGQKNLPQRQSTGELLANFVSSFSNYEGKFVLTTRYLITRPGFLAKEYNAGKRERYFHPVRMYAFISFIFFLLFFSLPDTDDVTELTEEDKAAMAQNERKVKESLFNSGIDTVLTQKADSLAPGADKQRKEPKMKYGLSKTAYSSVEAYDSAQQLKPEAERDGWLTRRFNIRSIELNQKYGDDSDRFAKDFVKGINDNFSKVLFFLLPVFALLLKLLYLRRGFFYSEHLVFSIYYYNFFYFAGSVMLLLGLVPSLSWAVQIIGFGIYFYLLAAMKQMYGQSWSKTIGKFFAFSFLFIIAIVLAAIVTILWIVMFL